MGELKSGYENLEDIAHELNVSADTVGELLLFIISDDNKAQADIPLPDDIKALFDKADAGETLTDEENAKIQKAVYYSGAIAIENYYLRVHDNPEKYIPVLRDMIDEFSKDKKDDETVDECVSRTLKSMSITFELSPVNQQPKTDIFAQPYIKLLNSELTNILFSLSLKNFDKNPITNIATYSENGVEIQIKEYDTIQNLTPSQLKLWDAAVGELTYNNFSSSDGTVIEKKSIQCTVDIPLIEYAKVRGINLTPKHMDTEQEQEKENAKVAGRRRHFCADIRRDLDVLQKISITGSVTKGKSSGDYKDLPFILNNPSIVGNNIIINFDPTMAELLVNSHIMQYSPKLQSIPDSNPNNLKVGRYLLLHSSMNNNRKRGTEFTLSVKSIINSTDAIPGYEQLNARGEVRKWKERSKKQLETVLNNLVKNGILSRWEYRNPKTQSPMTPDDVNHLTPIEFFNLRIDFVLCDDMPNRPEIGERNEVGTDA